MLQLLLDYVLWLPSWLLMLLSRYVLSSSSNLQYWLLHLQRSNWLSQVLAAGVWSMENSITLNSTMKLSAILRWHQMWGLRPVLMHYLNGGMCKSLFGEPSCFMIQYLLQPGLWCVHVQGPCASTAVSKLAVQCKAWEEEIIEIEG